MNVKQAALTAFSVMALATSAQSQELLGGFQITVAKPMGDLKDIVDDKLGTGLGGHLMFDLGKGHAIVPRLDFVSYKRTDGAKSEFVTKMKFTSLGADYNYYFSKQTNQGLYAAVGVAYTSGYVEYNAPVGSFCDRRSSIGFDAGIGYMFMHNVGAELKYNKLQYNNFYGVDVSTPSVIASIMLRF